jgi:hypothetical protein
MPAAVAAYFAHAIEDPRRVASAIDDVNLLSRELAECLDSEVFSARLIWSSGA